MYKKDTLAFHLLLLTLTWLLVHSLLGWKYGLRNLHDASLYVRYADALVQQGTLGDNQLLFYAVPISCMAFFRWLFPDTILPYLIFQCVLSLFATVALYYSGKKIFNNKIAGLLTGIVFLLWLDNLHWNITTMTESLACSFSCFLILCLVNFKGSPINWITLLLLITANFLTRPSGVVIIAGTIIFLLKYYWPHLQGKWLLKTAMIFLLLGASTWGANTMFSYWDFTDQYYRGNIITYMDTFHSAEQYKTLRIPPDNSITFGNPEDLPVIKVIKFITYNPLYFIKTAFLKIAYLLLAVRPYYSSGHNLYALGWVVVIYFFCYYGWKNCRYPAIRYFIAAVVVINCCLTGISSVDWDNRFYIPMEPAIVLLAGGGLSYFIDRLKKSKWFAYPSNKLP